MKKARKKKKFYGTYYLEGDRCKTGGGEYRDFQAGSGDLPPSNGDLDLERPPP